MYSGTNNTLLSSTNNIRRGNAALCVDNLTKMLETLRRYILRAQSQWQVTSMREKVMNYTLKAHVLRDLMSKFEAYRDFNFWLLTADLHHLNISWDISLSFPFGVIFQQQALLRRYSSLAPPGFNDGRYVHFWK